MQEPVGTKGLHRAVAGRAPGCSRSHLLPVRPQRELPQDPTSSNCVVTPSNHTEFKVCRGRSRPFLYARIKPPTQPSSLSHWLESPTGCHCHYKDQSDNILDLQMPVHLFGLECAPWSTQAPAGQRPDATHPPI